jgi:hypothetical protein
VTDFGKRASAAIAENCRTKQHQASHVNKDDYVLCDRCRESMRIVEEIGARERPELSLASVYLVVDPDSGKVRAEMDETTARDLATEHAGVVVKFPVWSDHRRRDTP